MKPGPAAFIAVLLALLIVPSGSALAAGPSGAPSVGPQVSVSLSPPTEAAQPTHSEFGTVMFDGNVGLDRMPGERATVALAASTDTGWGCACSPSMLVFMSNAAQSFTVTVSVPPGTLASLAGVLTVTAEATGTLFSSSDSATANVTVLPYYMVELQCENPTINLSVGGKGEFKVHLRDLGNANDSFDFTVANADELRRKGWTVTLRLPSIAFVPGGGSMYFFVNVEAPRSPSKVNAPQALELAATSRGSLARGPARSDTLVLHANLKGTEIDDPLNQMMIVAAVVVVAVAAAVLWRRRRRRARKAQAAPEPDGPIDVEPDEKVADQ